MKLTFFLDSMCNASALYSEGKGLSVVESFRFSVVLEPSSWLKSGQYHVWGAAVFAAPVSSLGARRSPATPRIPLGPRASGR